MDTFILAATSFTIAVSLMITGKKDKLQASFSGFCTAVFVSQIAAFSRHTFNAGFLLTLEYLGILAIGPTGLLFFRYLTRKKSFLSRALVILFTLISVAGVFFLFTPFSKWTYFDITIVSWSLFALGICYAALLFHVRNLTPGTEKKRLGYLIYACPIALLTGNIDLCNSLGMSLPVITGMALSILLYFILLIIAYPQLRELHDFFVRTLVIFINTLIGAAVFYLMLILIQSPLPPFTGILMASFLIAIALSPVKMILKKIFSYFYPDSKDVFTSLYEFDDKLEKEKALMLSEMAPVFAHEIRNPLGSIKGAAQYLQSEASTREQQELFNVIVEGTDRLNNVVSQFLDYARPYKLDLRLQNVNLVVRKAVSVVSANLAAKKITITQELSEDLPEIKVDEQQLIQVVLNIALNAVEAMPLGGTLTFRTSKKETSAGDKINITISDTGSGIAREEIKNIFKPFFTTKERGVGLGLAICRKIIKEHGGQIRVKSFPHQGTVFVIRLQAGESL